MCLSRTSCKHNTVYLGGWQTGSATQAISDHTEEWFTCLACHPAKSRAVTSVMRVGLTKMVSPIFFFCWAQWFPGKAESAETKK